MLRPIIIIPVITLLLTLVLMTEMLVLNYFLTLFQWRLEYLYHPVFIDELFFVLFYVIFILVGSLFFRKSKHKKSIYKVGLITGAMALGFTLVLLVLFSYSFDIWASFILMGSAMFIIGFLFPLLYKLLSKKPLFSMNFY